MMQQFVVVLLKMESPQTEWPDQFFHVVPTGAGNSVCLDAFLRQNTVDYSFPLEI